MGLKNAKTLVWSSKTFIAAQSGVINGPKLYQSLRTNSFTMEMCSTYLSVNLHHVEI